jgi:homocitrate synthase
MCPPTEEAPATNGSNGTNGTNGANGSHEGYTSVRTKQNPHPTHKSPYQPVGDFLSNVSRFKIIGTSFAMPFSKRYRMRTRGQKFCY